jgi:outer membrane protease
MQKFMAPQPHVESPALSMPPRIKIAVTVLVLVQAASLCIAQQAADTNWTFSTGTGPELLYGTAYEYVYDGSNKLSELDWDIKPLFSIGSTARAKIGNVELGIALSAGFPGRAGSMTDSDWMNVGYANSDLKTNYSVSEAVAEHMTDLRLSLGYEYAISRVFGIKPFMGYRLIDLAWNAKGGWLQYADNIANPSPPYHSYTTGPKESLYGLISTYEQAYSSLIFGISADWRLSRNLALEANLQASPLISSTAIDNHILRGLTFTDRMSGGFLLEPDLAIGWSPVDRLSLRAHCRYLLISGLRGDETVTAATNVDAGAGLSPGQSVLFTDSAGAAMHAFGFGISADWRL